MLEHTDFMAIISAGAGLAGAVLAGLLLRLLFGVLARRAAKTERPWDDVGWALLRSVAIPLSALFGAWWVAEALRPPDPARGVFDRVLLALTVLVVALAVARLAGDLVRSVTVARSGVAGSATIFVNLTRVVVIVIGVLVLLQSMGISVTPMLTALGVGGLAVALALQGTLANVFAGIQILASKKVQPGDFVRLDSGENGYVVDINWRHTTIRQLAGNIIIVPNARLGDTILTNFHQPASDMSVLVQVGVAYGSDLEHVERVTIEVSSDVMATVRGGVPSHEPFIRYHTFGDSSINFSVILRAAEYADQYVVVHEFIKRLHRRYREEGIEIPFPIRTIVQEPALVSAADAIPTQVGHPD